jgi:integral membrane sensor domain MASE1
MTTDRPSFQARPQIRRTALTALLVLLGCYAGARAGTLLQFPRIGAAVLFPPYAVLAAALILSPARRWWLYVLASAVGNFWPHLQHEGLASFVMTAEVANIGRALVAA